MAAVSNRRKRFNSYNILRYPYKMFADGTDYLQIDMMDYVPVAKFMGTQTLTETTTTDGKESETNTREVDKFQSYTRDPIEGFRRNTNKEPLGTVLLPIPSNLADGNTVNYTDDTMNTLVGAGLGLSMNIMKNVGSLVGQMKFGEARKLLLSSAKSAIEASGLTVDNALDLITKQLAGSALSTFGGNVTLDQIQARESGQIFNPNMELLFNGPSLRNFSFSFKMTPRSPEESKEVKTIIRFFKRGMAAKAGGSRLFLSTPNIFELRYRKGAGEHPFLNRFKQCFLTDIAVNYTGEGVYATYDDGTPVSMTMTLSFKEVAPIYDVDYDSVGTGPLADPDRAFGEGNTGFGGVGY